MDYSKFYKTDGITFDDILIVPSESEVIPREVDISTRLTSKIKLNMPILSAAMDRVTQHKMAIKMAQLGGIGIIHKNMSAEDQAHQVFKVKNFEVGRIKNPITLSIYSNLENYYKARKEYGFSSFPIVDDNEFLEGFISEKDVKFINDTNIPLSQIMTKKDKLITVNSNITSIEAKNKMQQEKIEQLLIVDNNKLVGLISAQGFVEAKLYPNASRDKEDKLMVGASIGASDSEKNRLEKLIEGGVDLVVIDTAHGHSHNVRNMVEYIKKTYSSIDVVAGNIATYDGARFLIDAGADCVKVGIGSGSICTTRSVTGVGVPQITALLDVKKACDEISRKITFVSDGGIKQSGDFAKAIATGASGVMLGSLLAGTKETPGDIITIKGQSYKEYRGMGSISAMVSGSADRYSQSEALNKKEKLVAEGVDARVRYKGNVEDIIFQLLGGLRSSMGYTGSKSIESFHSRSKFCRITNAGLKESHVHSVEVIDNENTKIT